MSEAARIAHALHGEVVGRDAILAPGPQHSRQDRSLSVKLDREHRTASQSTRTLAMTGAYVAIMSGSGLACRRGGQATNRNDPSRASMWRNGIWRPSRLRQTNGLARGAKMN